ncbi:MAG: hypothetical protein HZRFUVUK_000033 [Candidatus Fervidibacterota bacterium]
MDMMTKEELKEEKRKSVFGTIAKGSLNRLYSWLYVIWLIAWREVKSFFTSWIAYVMLLFFLVLCGFIFYAIFMVGRTSDMRYFFWDVAVLLMFITPTMTMRLFAEERRLGTLELLLTSPVTDWQVVLGKFFGSFIVLCITLALTLYVPIVVKRIANPDLGPYWSAYIGLLFYGSVMLSIGTFWSATTDNQIIAAVATFGTLLLLYIISWPAEGLSGWSEVFQRLSLYYRYKDFAEGLVDTKHIVFYLTTTFLTLYFAVKVLESRLWR